MLEILLFLIPAQVAVSTQPIFRCVEPQAMAASPVVVEEASDLDEWFGLDDAAKKRMGDHSLRICGAVSGCMHPDKCAPFADNDRVLYQRLGIFRLLPSEKGKPRVRFLLQAWNDGAEVGEFARSMGGVQVLTPTAGDSFTSEFGTIPVIEQSQVEIVRDSLLVVAQHEWAKDETRYAPHHFHIRAWNLNHHVVVDSPSVSYVTRWRYRSLDDVDTLDVIRHEIPSIGMFLQKRDR
jgi:hypothetical protein